MKRLLFPLVACLLILAACDKTPKYKISGTISSDTHAGKTVYLRAPGESGLEKKAFDSAIIAKNTFVMQGAVQEPGLYFINLGDEAPFAPVFVEAGSIMVSIDSTEYDLTSITGSPLNDLYTKYKGGTKEFMDARKALIESFRTEHQNGTMTPERQSEVMDKMGEINDQIVDYQRQFIGENPNNLATAFILSNAMSQGLSSEDARAAIDKFDSTLLKSSFVQMINKRLTAQEEREAKEVKEGQDFVDLKMQTPEGKDIAISDYAAKGKYVLLDFWASWCGPCRQENPNVVKAYAKFKDKGFEIVGISLDKEKDKWIAGIKEDKITWPQMSDLKQWQSEAVEKYGIQGIPFTVLLDKEGKVLAKNLRGAALENKLSELLD
ncbi:MAG: AhpC/TSA family protein [Prevotellaceae bacterium]|jgi:peroxiredoxin|nr:AhpC/TSA family protein [Prevotellaceae bacterium]